MSERVEIDLDALEALTKAATPGAWIADEGRFGHLEAVITTHAREDASYVPICEMGVDFVGDIGAEQRANRDFIIAANPAVVAELIRRLREAESAVNRLQSACREIKEITQASKKDLKDLQDQVGMAYGYLWCVNNEPGTPNRYSSERAAYEARKLLRDTLTKEQRGDYINKVVQIVRGDAAMGEPK